MTSPVKNTYSKVTYCCPNCSTIQDHYTWSASINTTKHLCDHGGCGTMLMVQNILKPKKISVPGLRTDTKNRV